jgi:hypothetical protein
VALLSRATAWIVLVCALNEAGCATTAPLGHVELWLQSCAGRASSCADQPPSPPNGEHFVAQAFIDPSASRYAPHGLYTYFELPRADGSLGLFELDVPTDASGDTALQHFQASYRELSGQQLRFASTVVEGRVEVPASWSVDGNASCACEDGGLELRFEDPGDDGVAGTPDDRVRRLSSGRFGLSKAFCRPFAPMSIPVGLHVDLDRCGAAVITQEQQPSASASVSTSAPPPNSPSGGPCAHGCYGESGALYRNQANGCGSSDAGGGCGTYDTASGSSNGGCGSSPAAGEGSGEQASSGSGCSSNSSSSSSSTSSSSSSGCEGDSSSSKSGSGCEGDTSQDNSSSCALAHHVWPREPRPRGSDPFAGTGLPLALTCLFQRLRAWRLRAKV